MKLMQGIPHESVDMVITDPPYGIDYQSNRPKGEKKPKIKNDKRPYIWFIRDAA